MPKVGSSLRGYFWCVTAEDRRVAQQSLHGRAIAELGREKRIRDAADGGQLGLWDEGGA
jgi:hypothetical protein